MKIKPKINFSCILVCALLLIAKSIKPENLSFIEQLKAQKILEIGQPTLYENSIFDNDTEQELELKQLVYHLDRTQTVFGLGGLFQLLKPLTNIQEIKTRQKFVKKLTTDDEFYEKLRTILNLIHERENSLMRYWDKDDEIHKAADGLYFGLFGSYLNSSAFLLEWANLRELALKTISLSGVFCLTTLASETAFAANEGRAPNYKRALLQRLKKPLTPYSLEYNRYAPSNIKQCPKGKSGVIGWLSTKLFGKKQENSGSQFIEDRTWSLADSARWYNENVKIPGTNRTIPKWIAYPWQAANTFGMDAMWAYSCIKEVQALKGLFETQTKLQGELVNTREILTLTKEITQAAQDSQELQKQEFCKKFEYFSNKKVNTISNKLQEALELLGTSTFNSKASLIYSRGRMLRAHKLLKETKYEWLELIRAIGQLDAFVSIASLYREHKNQKITLCFPTYSEQKQPKILADSLWNPFIDQNKARPNSIKLGNNMARMALITGPNALGKTTVMKSLAYAIIFAQGWTIAPAKALELTPFTGMRTYLNISDNLQQNLSSFMAEKKRAQAMVSYAHKNQHKKIFFLLDEPYRGTYPDEAGNRAFDLCSELAQQEHCITTVATHLHKPITLENDNQKCSNYHLYVEEQGHEFIPHYKLIPGACTWWFENSEKRARFIDWLFAQ